MSSLKNSLYSTEKFEGQISDGRFNNVLTKYSSVNDRKIEFGNVLTFTNDGLGVKTPIQGINQVTAGFAVKIAKGASIFSTELYEGYSQSQAVNVLTRGSIWCRLADTSHAVSLGDPVFASSGVAGKAIADLDTNISNWNAVLDGSITVSINSGPDQELVGLNFSSDLDLDAIATRLQGNITGANVTAIGSEMLFRTDVVREGNTILITNGIAGTNLLDTLLTSFQFQDGSNEGEGQVTGDGTNSQMPVKTAVFSSAGVAGDMVLVTINLF